MLTIRRALIGSVLVLAWACARPEDNAPPRGESPDAHPTTVQIVCERDGSTRLLTPQVTAQADGVHVQVENRAGEPVSMNGLGLDFDEKGISEQVATEPPGTVRVACWPFSRHDGPEPPRQPLEILDPNRYWVNPEPECPAGALGLGAILDYGAGAEGETGDPVDIARRRLHGVRPEDVVERAGYPQARHAIVRVVRDGRPVAAATFQATAGGGWLLGGLDTCSGSGITAG